MADDREIVAIEIDRLFQFIDGLQTSGYKIDPRQIAALNQLLIMLVARGESLDELPLKIMIAPLVCSTQLEQEDFYRRFDRWQATLLPIKQIASTENLPFAPRPQESPPKEELTLVPESTEPLQDSAYISREATKQEVNYTKVHVKGYVQEILPLRRIKPIVSALRKRTQIPSTDVDVEKTIEIAIKNQNWVEIIYHQHHVLPEYVVLIDRKNRLDLQARFIQEVLGKLSADDVWLHQYEFKGDPRICFPLGKKNTPLRLREIQARHPDSRLLIFSGVNELTNPLTGNLQDWVESLEPWENRAILTPDKLDKKLHEELEDQGFVALPLTFDGLTSVVRVFEAENILVPFSDSNLPAPLTERPTRWTGRSAPPEAEVSALISDLKNNYLGKNGFYWLCATAVYPELRWELALHLGSVLKDEVNKPLLDVNSLTRLARLPWFRFGYMPDWIRLPLIESFLPEQEIQVREVISNLLSSSQDGIRFELTIAREASGTLTKQVLQDHVLIKFLAKSDQKKLAVSVPPTLQDAFDYSQQYNQSNENIEIQSEKSEFETQPQKNVSTGTNFIIDPDFDFIDREVETAYFFDLLRNQDKELQFSDHRKVIHLIGRSNVGKSSLLKHWYRMSESQPTLLFRFISLIDFIHLNDMTFIIKLFDYLNSIFGFQSPNITSNANVSLPFNENLRVLQKERKVVFLIDECDLLSIDQIQMLEDYFLSSCLELPNIMVVFAGRHTVTGFKDFSLRPMMGIGQYWDKGNIIELLNFDFEYTKRQIQAINPKIVDLATRIYEISGGSPGNNKKIVEQLGNSQQFNELGAIRLCNEEFYSGLYEIEQGLPQSIVNDLLPVLESLCVLQDFDKEYEMPKMLSIHPSLSGDWSVHRCANLLNILSKVQIGPGKLIDWDMEKSALAMEDQTRFNLEKELKIRDINLWKTLHCNAMKMYSDWAIQYGADSIFVDKEEYHKTQLVNAGIDPETC